MQLSNMDQFVPVKESKIDFSKVFHKLRAHWLYCVIFAAVMVSLAIAYLYVANPTYRAMATVLIKDNNGQTTAVPNSGIASLQSLGLFPGASNVDNEREIIGSYPLILEVVENLQLYLNFTSYNHFINEPLYKESLPFTCRVDHFTTRHLTDDQRSYEIMLTGQSGFSIVSDHHEWKGQWGNDILLPFGMVRLEKDQLTDSWDSARMIKMTVSGIAAVADIYQSSINAEVSNKQTSIIDLSLSTKIPEQGMDIMNRLIEVYQLSNIKDNNRITDSTIKFINNRLNLVGAELDSIEGNIQHFKQQNDLADLPTQSQALITNAGANYKDLADQQVQLSITNSLIDYMEANKENDRVVPASLTIFDASVTSLIDNYNRLLMQRERLLLSATKHHPVVLNLDSQIANLKGDMVNSLYSIQHSLEAGIGKMQQNEGALNDKIRRVPAQQRTFVEYSRQQSIKQELFLFLLQKREESLIAKSSTVSSARVIVPGRVATKPIAPNRKLILSFALLAGLMIPFVFSFFRDLVNQKVENKEDIENNTQTPILAEILHNHTASEKGIVVTQSARDASAEQFRILRTELNYLQPGNDHKVILLTSSMPDEGKSYVSLNLSAMMAFSGKKVVVLEFDLRKPKLAERLGIRPDKGFTHYAVQKADLSEIIYPVADYPNLFIIPSGPTPPNPAELIQLDRTKDLFTRLKQEFDYILIDSAPCIVTDARLLSRYTDLTLFLIRVGTTYKEQVKQVQRFYQSGKFPHLHLIVNDINRKKRKYYYGYDRYKERYGYFEK